jgi:ribonuclease BN (tRNA processing enzyme)
VRVQFLGTGTPLGQAGRLQACILVSTDDTRVLLDCGMTSLVGLARAHVEPESLDAIVISHLHGDHFGGLPLVVLESALREETGRAQGLDRPLRIAGPVGTADRVRQALDAFGWHGAWTTALRSGNVEFVTLRDRQPEVVAGVEITAYAVPHNPATAPTALRVSSGGKTIAYSGDSGWTETLHEVAAGADLFICGVWSFEMLDPQFLDYATLRQHRAELTCKRLILTHLGPSALDHLAQLSEDHVEVAEDGWAVEL